MRINHILFFSLLCFADEGKAVEDKWTYAKIQHLKPKKDFLDPKKQGLTEIRPLMQKKIARVIQAESLLQRLFNKAFSVYAMKNNDGGSVEAFTQKEKFNVMYVFFSLFDQQDFENKIPEYSQAYQITPRGEEILSILLNPNHFASETEFAQISQKCRDMKKALKSVNKEISERKANILAPFKVNKKDYRINSLQWNRDLVRFQNREIKRQNNNRLIDLWFLLAE